MKNYFEEQSLAGMTNSAQSLTASLTLTSESNMVNLSPLPSSFSLFS